MNLHRNDQTANLTRVTVNQRLWLNHSLLLILWVSVVKQCANSLAFSPIGRLIFNWIRKMAVITLMVASKILSIKIIYSKQNRAVWPLNWRSWNVTGAEPLWLVGTPSYGFTMYISQSIYGQQVATVTGVFTVLSWDKMLTVCKERSPVSKLFFFFFLSKEKPNHWHNLRATLYPENTPTQPRSWFVFIQVNAWIYTGCGSSSDRTACSAHPPTK